MKDDYDKMKAWADDVERPDGYWQWMGTDKEHFTKATPRR